MAKALAPAVAAAVPSAIAVKPKRNKDIKKGFLVMGTPENAVFRRAH